VTTQSGAYCWSAAACETSSATFGTNAQHQFAIAFALQLMRTVFLGAVQRVCGAILSATVGLK